MSLRSSLARLSQRLFPGSAGEKRWERSARRLGLLPVWGDWVGSYALTPELEVVFSEDFLLAGVEPVTDPRLRVITLFEASRRYPELSHLMPVRGPEDRTCPGCNGTGVVPNIPPEQRDKIICWCGGLGWVPVGTPDP